MAKKPSSRAARRRRADTSSTSEAPQTERSRRTSPRRSSAASGKTLFGRANYMILFIALLLIAVGYVSMALDNQIQGFVPLYLSPTLLMAGYLLVIYAIMHRSRPSSGDGVEG